MKIVMQVRFGTCAIALALALGVHLAEASEGHEAEGALATTDDQVSLPPYRDEIYSLQILLSRPQAGPGRTVKQEQEEISPNHVQTLNLISV